MMLHKNCILLWKSILNQNMKCFFLFVIRVMMFFRSTEHMLSLRPKAWGLHRPAKAACKSKQRKERERTPQDIDILAGEESSFIYLHLKGHCVLCSVNPACEEHGRWKNKLGVTTQKAKTTQQGLQQKEIEGDRKRRK